MVKKILFTFFFVMLYFSKAFADFIPLSGEEAFQFSATLKNPTTLEAHWNIQPGYYLYQDRISFKLIDGKDAVLGNIQRPQGFLQQDNILGTYRLYDGQVKMTLPLQYKNAKSLTLMVCFQGCSFNHFCYPPITKQVTFNPNMDVGIPLKVMEPPASFEEKSAAPQDRIQHLLTTHARWITLLSFLGFGILLAFTPCVLPMVPILSGIILGHGKTLTHSKSFLLSLTYVLGMSVTYAIIGVIAAWVGVSLQAFMQNPWVLSVFSGIFILLALSLLGLFEIRLPEKFEMRLLGISRHQKSGSYVGVAVMGVLSTLILSPCVTAPLIGALTYISETHDVVFGGSALFFLSLGMGIPLLVMGTVGGHFLPRAGAWMNSIKSFFGILLLAVAIEILSRILPPSIPLFLWGALGILCAALLGLFNGRPPGRWKWLWRGLSLIFLIYSILLMIGGAMGNTNPLKPLENFNSSSSVTATEALFIPIKTPEDLSLQLNKAKENHQLTLLDFYADWCIACKDMARTTFANAEIQELLKKHFRLLQADVTNHDKIDQRLQQQLHVIAPPTLVVFDVDGREMKKVRMVGEVGPQAFKKWIEKVLKAHTPSP